MSTSPCHPDRRGLTGPHPNLLSDFRLRTPRGAAVSLHRYAGRWVILRLTEGASDAIAPIAGLSPADFVSLNVVAGPVVDTGPAGSVIYDSAREFAQRFPAIACPAIFVIDPDGRLIAILDDRGWPAFLAELVRSTGRVPAHGAIDRQDITR